MLKEADLNLWEEWKQEGIKEGREKGQRETLQRLFIKGAITYEYLVEELGKEEAEAIRDIRDKTKETL